ncbi:S1 RNA binding domain protein [Peptoanaerobacter stomatis]|uniref:S1 RNA binding domain protein n=1 Tax=Peptoanaerobacter stomatis TaxID=796937 RepID=J5WEV8_9FIRM|nr:S1 RNA binding domain protein [Peptoanaerobacter stomatis]
MAYKGNIKGFLPLSHIELKYINEDIAKSYIGKEFEAEILDIDPKKRRLILSRKSILQKVQDEKLKELSETIQEGKVFKGVVKDIKDYGIFVDIGGIVGLVHVSEISWARNKKIKDSFELEQEVEVQVLSYTPEEKRLSLSIKSLEPNPWDEYVKSHKEGDIVDGEVKNIKDYGAFISLYPIVDGFVHISNLSEDFVKNPSEILKTGDKVKVKIIGINPEEKKIELSMLLEDKKQEEPEVQPEQNETEA